MPTTDQKTFLRNLIVNERRRAERESTASQVDKDNPSLSVVRPSSRLRASSPSVFQRLGGEPCDRPASFTAFTSGATTTGLVAPFALAFDSGHNLWVADAGGNRVLEYKTPLSTHEAASLVIGQSSFTTLAPATTSAGLNTPNGLAFDSSGNLWVVDSSNNRVLEFKTPSQPGEAASLVIVKSNFTTNY